MAKPFDVVIRNALIYDGSGADAVQGDVGLRGERIAAVGAVEGDVGTEIDATGLAIAPGFIDVHSHDDLALFLWPEMDFKVMQGVTVDIVGNCGMGAAPGVEAQRNVAAFDPEGSVPDWDGYDGFMNAVDADPPSLNVAVLMGHGTARGAAMGGTTGAAAEREPSDEERQQMRALFAQGMDAGEIGRASCRERV